MTEGRFYSLLMVVYAVAVVGLLLLFNWAQKPEGLDRQLVTTVLAFLGPFGLVLLNNMANSKQAQKLHEGQEQIKQEIHAAPAELKQAAEDAKHTIKDEAERAATDLKQTASALAREKR